MIALVLLLAGSAFALPLPVGGFFGGYSIDVSSWNVTQSDVRLVEAWYLDGSHAFYSGDDALGAQVTAGMMFEVRGTGFTVYFTQEKS